MKWNGLKCLETAGIGDDKDNDNDGDDEASNELAGLMTVLTLSFLIRLPYHGLWNFHHATHIGRHVKLQF